MSRTTGKETAGRSVVSNASKRRVNTPNRLRYVDHLLHADIISAIYGICCCVQDRHQYIVAPTEESYVRTMQILVYDLHHPGT